MRTSKTVLEEIREEVVEGGENTDGKEELAQKSGQKSQGGRQGYHHGVRDKIKKFGGICKVKTSQEGTRIRKILDNSREVTEVRPSQEASGRGW